MGTIHQRGRSGADGVDDVDRQVDFYVEKLGLPLAVPGAGTDMAFFDAGSFRLYVDRWYEGAPVSRPVLYFTGGIGPGSP